jgi:signal recognition particle receptor subunit beta
MVINQSSKEITAKIVYYGPALSGKTTNLQYLHEYLDPKEKGKLLSISTEGDRTIFFDFMPIELGEVKGFKLRLQLYTVPGQTFYEETRKRVLKGADGVVFVADSQKDMAKANKEAFEQLKMHLSENGLNPDKMPIVLQFNKRDLKNIMNFEEMDKALNPGNIPFFEAIATEGVGVEDTLKSISKLVVNNILTQLTETQRITKERNAMGKKLQKDFFAMDTEKLLTEIGVSTANNKKKSAENLFVDEPHEISADESTSAVNGNSAELFEHDDAETSLLSREGEEEALLLTEDEELKVPEEESVDTGNFTSPSGEIKLKSGEKTYLSLEINGKKYKLIIELKPEE